MTNEELARQLNEEVGLSGKQAVTANVIRQWVGWQLLRPARIMGKTIDGKPIWKRDELALGQALRLATYRSYGLVREDQLICRSYIGGWEIDDEQLRKKACARSRAFHATTLKRFTSTFHREKRETLSETKKKAIRNQIGPLDKRFKGTVFELVADDYVSIFREAIAGKAQFGNLVRPLLAKVDAIMPGLELQNTAYFRLFTNSVGGFYATPDQFVETAYKSIEMSGKADFEFARAVILQLFKLPNFIGQFENHLALPPETIGPIRKIGDTLRIIEKSEWPTFLFLMVLHGLQKLENEKQLITAEIQALNDVLAGLNAPDLLSYSNAVGTERL